MELTYKMEIGLTDAENKQGHQGVRGEGRDKLGDWNWYICTVWGFPGGSESKESACIAGDSGSIPVLGRSPGEGNGNLF